VTPRLVLIRPRKLSKHEKLLTALLEIRRIGNGVRAEMAKEERKGKVRPLPGR
jgi:hypothetical protein